MVKVAVNRNKTAADVCSQSFFQFVKHFWGKINEIEPVWNWHIEFICNELQRAAERVFNNLPKEYDYVINVPPGTTKSTICSIMYPAWILARMPHAQIICASFTDRLTLQLSKKCRDIVQDKEYMELFPHVRIQKKKDTEHLWQTTRNGFRLAATVSGANPTGFHGHFIIVDDPIDPDDARSEVKINSANDFMEQTLGQRKVNQLLTVTILIMQRLHQNDPTGHRLKSEVLGPVRHLCFPAELSDQVRPGYCKRFYIDGVLDPIRLPRAVLEQKKKHSYLYAGQYMQKPIPLSGGMFHTEKLNFGIPPRPDSKRWKIRARYWDKAGTKDAGCFTAGALEGLEKLDDGTLRPWLLDIRKGQWEANAREKMIVQTAKVDGRKVKIGLEQEPGSSGLESAQATARRLLGYNVWLDKVTGDKIDRAEPFAAEVNAGNVWVPENAEWLADFLDEAQYFPDSTYKDQVDATSGSFNMITKPLIRIGAF